MSRQTEIINLIIKHHRRLVKLQEQSAITGIATDPSLLIEIEDIQDTIKALELELETGQATPSGSPSTEQPQSQPKTTGDQISIGSIQGSNFVVGSGGTVNVDQVLGAASSDANHQTGVENSPLQAIYQQIADRPSDANVDKGELIKTVDRIDAEINQGAQMNLTKLKRQLGKLARIAPDIFASTVASVEASATGGGADFTRLVEQIRSENNL